MRGHSLIYQSVLPAPVKESVHCSVKIPLIVLRSQVGVGVQPRHATLGEKESGNEKVAEGKGAGVDVPSAPPVMCRGRNPSLS